MGEHHRMLALYRTQAIEALDIALPAVRRADEGIE